jgi:tetratricopeptide (TPR) repeat protein
VKNAQAELFRKKGEYDRALPLYEECQAKRKRVLGDDHPSTLVSLNNLAVLFESKGEHDRALPLFEECLRRAEAQRRREAEEKEKANKELNKLTSAEGILNESIAAVSSVGSTRYSGVSKALIQLTGTVIYNFTDDEEVKKKAKSLTRDITFKNPFEIKRKKDGDVVGYGMRDKITAEIAMYLPPLATAGDNVYKVLESLGGYPYLYNKALNGELLSEPEKEALVLAQLFVNASNAVLMFSGGAIPFSNEINKFAKKELKDEKKKETKGEIKETEVTEKDVIETEVTPTEIQ